MLQPPPSDPPRFDFCRASRRAARSSTAASSSCRASRTGAAT
jgi:hypothetical protein